jgi:hypothetical protein
VTCREILLFKIFVHVEVTCGHWSVAACAAARCAAALGLARTGAGAWPRAVAAAIMMRGN